MTITNNEIINDNVKNVVVSIHCLVYNHEPYLRECLDGFVMQKTNFLFEAIVHDDASTDGSAAIIREYAEKYPDIIKPIFETENQYSKHDGSLGRIMDAACTGKYIAYCEGDDYWINPNKLQMQVDWLETHPDYAMVYTDHLRWNKEKHKRPWRYGLINSYDNKKEYDTPQERFYSLMHKRTPWTLTVMIRQSVYKSIKPDTKEFMMGDTLLYMNISQLGDIKYMNEVTAVYRIHTGSASHTRSTYHKFVLNAKEARVFYCYKFGYDVPLFIKKKYNRCYSNIIIKEINYKPMYDFFDLGRGNRIYINMIKEYKWFRSICRLIVCDQPVIIKRLGVLMHYAYAISRNVVLEKIKG